MIGAILITDKSSFNSLQITLALIYKSIDWTPRMNSQLDLLIHDSLSYLLELAMD